MDFRSYLQALLGCTQGFFRSRYTLRVNGSRIEGVMKVNKFRLIAWGETKDGTLDACEDIGRYNTLTEVEEWARGILDDGNAEYIEIFEGDRKIKTLYPKGHHAS